MKRLLTCTVMLCGILFQDNFVWAECNAREYIPASPGCFGILFYYNDTSADTFYSDGHKVSDDLDFSQHIGTFRLAYYWEIAGFTCYSNLLIPFGTLDLDHSPSGQDYYASGIADPIIQSGIFFYNNNKSKTWCGFSTYIFPPIGDYENDGVLSLGANQWRFREECGFAKGFCVLPDHNAYFELILAGDFFTDNNDFGPAGYKKSTDPILTVESHLSYDLTNSSFVAADYYYHNGGETQVNGTDQQDKLSNHTLGFSFAYNITPKFQVLLQYKNDFEVKSGLKNQAIVTRLFYICDLGYLFGRLAAPRK